MSSVLRPCQHSIGYMGDGFYRFLQYKVLKNIQYTDNAKRYNNQIYTVFRKKTPTHIFFHISMTDL